MEENTTIFGIRAIIEAIESEASINKVYLQKGLRGELFFELDKLLRKNKVSISVVPTEKLDRLSKHSNHQGAVARISPVDFHDLETLIETTLESDKMPLFLLLDQVSDVRNFGAIIRTAECTGVNGIIIQKSGSAPINAETIKTSAGAAFKIPICKVDHIKDAMFQLQAENIKLIAATEKTEDSVFDVDFNQPVAIIMGSEHKGVSNSVLKMADYKAKLPLLGEIESLNVSVACGVFLYETIRQRQ
ncbi:23S rRNA (guanosine(2251)-2'-O)-methyltransferase RlmB [Tenacibaculum finnmarkense]|uniref:23S rRNA (guanosine(2251)-2'-O)-methyltransferase RlmB n=1 Tax=Tenacibaculum finnmarkense TaxID=2781243 RepID=UPI00187B45FC|nr:23S rRNA (guanosine(2251)-2'-O)-methyltransferase RlmB [Tenacibaculum finnmarkense]MBE7661206.1 23S rRNA (guanosine(2251)-2'-O)-methyltransferase RlmB [Tenacibaculum finnmarkense genomovar finnmarkense]MCG8252776.1 23S rRNA (guanosine(2251)-2'-O)-methyltransferase RlmB [Tenacibaculum finnmarkense genomovar finnmarkense]MCG8816251.1 23S rRNA (guanosine(2251)-2'-O)-methyltransferase RlmB [Tenacibaculum finnmarkense]MCG8821251.1 23S rRNA (guanosine(2251)-2'-O)-methyltransferase RlmB [Tenacibacu